MQKSTVLACLAMMCLTACASMTMARLPLQFTLVDKDTKQPVQNASVKLVWRVGIGGIIWGKPVSLLSDSNGMVIASSENIPALDELGGPLRHPLETIMVDRIILKAQGYETLYLRPHGSQLQSVLELQRQRAPAVSNKVTNE